ncbi:MAG TPA: acetyltransferase [Xanthobacteraceae bacterium]|jgi:sugar O-acyltransferase (sialic acid O-acetyltransferase NeuD family)
MREVVVWGATGQARVLNECLFDSDIRIVAIFDNTSLAPPFDDIPLHIGEDGFRSWMKARGNAGKLHFLVAVGGQDRLQLHDWLVEEGLRPLTVTHRVAYVAADAALGPGCQILAHATVCAQARLERSVIVNTAASVDHECRIGPGTHVGPGVRLAGRVEIGQRAFVGAGAVVLPRLKVGDGAIIGAGAVVVRDVPAGAVVTGVPARARPHPLQQPSTRV